MFFDLILEDTGQKRIESLEWLINFFFTWTCSFSMDPDFLNPIRIFRIQSGFFADPYLDSGKKSPIRTKGPGSETLNVSINGVGGTEAL